MRNLKTCQLEKGDDDFLKNADHKYLMMFADVCNSAEIIKELYGFENPNHLYPQAQTIGVNQVATEAAVYKDSKFECSGCLQGASGCRVAYC